jgi:hypothetical protein
LKYLLILLVFIVINQFEFNVHYYLYLELAFLIFLLADIKMDIQTFMPIANLISLLFFIENSFCLTLIDILFQGQSYAGLNYFSEIPIDKLLPYTFACTIIFHLGLITFKPSMEVLLKIRENLLFKLQWNDFIPFAVLGVIGLVISNLNLSSLNQITFVTFGMLNAAIFGYAFKTKSGLWLKILPVAIQMLLTIRGGMFGDLLIYLVFFVMVLFFQRSRRSLSLFGFVALILIGTVGLAYSQIVKGEIRSENGRKSEFGDAVVNSSSSITPTSVEYYQPILLRLNQAWLVSACIERVEIEKNFQNGNTLLDAFFSAFLPRILFPNKEKAGGKEKVSKYTYLVLNANTSMNIGLVGESFLNFGYYGVLCIFFTGLLYSRFIYFFLKLCSVKSLYLFVLPVFFFVLLGSGTDYLSVLNGIFKNSIIVFGFGYLTSRQIKI